jgi:sugar lactone lactonase YvrE
MYIAHSPSGAALPATRFQRPGGKATRGFALARALVLLASAALPCFGQALVSSFDGINGPTFVALDSSRAIGGTTATWLYVSEHGGTNNTGGGRILRYNTAAPTTAPVDIGKGHFVSPDGILIDPTTGDLIIADRAQDRITRIANDGTVKWTFGSGTAGAADEMHGPCAVAMDAAGALYIAEHGETTSTPVGAGGNHVSKYTVSATGQAQRQFRIGGTGNGNGQFANTGPYGIAVANNQLLVSDGFNARVQVFGLDGTYLSQFPVPNALPLGLTLDSSGNLWVAESSGAGDGPIQRVEKMSTAGVSSGVTLTTSNPALALPFDAAVDLTANRAYVADYGNHRVAVFDLAASSSGGTSSGGTSSGGSSSGGTSTGGTSTGGTSSGGSTTGGTSTGGTSTGTGSGTATASVASVTVPANGTYSAGDRLVFTVHFSAPVKVTGKVVESEEDETDDDDGGAKIAWTAVAASGANPDSGYAVLVGPVGSNDLTFKYQVHGNDVAPNGIKLGASILLPSGVTITDTAGTPLTAAQLTLPLAQNPLSGVILVPPKEAKGGKKDKDAKLINLSSRVHVKHGDASRATIVGFVVSGSGTQSVLVRAVGPGLRGFGVSDALTDTSLVVQNGAGKVLATNSGWSASSVVAQIAQKVGAFSLDKGSKDSAVVLTLSPGAYTATILGSKSEGEALIELYDAAALGTAVSPQLVNISTRGYVDAGENLIAGFVVQGTAPKRVLVRAVGPGLTPFGVAGALSDPKLEVHDSAGAVLATNDNWGTPQSTDAAHPAATAADVTAADTAAGAFPLAAGSRDSAVVVTLNPGSYTAVVSGVGQTSGAILVEVYELAAP